MAAANSQVGGGPGTPMVTQLATDPIAVLPGQR
ncbi:hypothetical protein FrEUN1fDRAFT_5421 [Parafrankia sp. EUN1f]|nr:hypothetical protein FrEUN1fDRAFT_5421 [Parafrankia sp. EUN1f]